MIASFSRALAQDLRRSMSDAELMDSLDYTLFRPFNWIGAGLDSINTAKEGSSRVFTQFLSNVLHRKPIQLVDGGQHLLGNGE